MFEKTTAVGAEAKRRTTTVGAEAKRRTTTVGAEAKRRGRATYLALKGDLRAPEPAGHRTRNIALIVGAVGGAVLFLAARRRHEPEWLTADATPEFGLEPGEPAPGRSAGWPDSARGGDRAAASVDEMIADAAETATSGPISPQRHR